MFAGGTESSPLFISDGETMDRKKIIEPEIGKMQELEICSIDEKGCFVDAGEERLFVPRSQLPENARIGDMINVFLYVDDGRLYATAKRPKIAVGEFGSLEVKAVGKFGYFLDNYMRKDLFLPFDESRGMLKPGREVIVYAYLDYEQRMCATTMINNKCSEFVTDGYDVGKRVKVLAVARTDLGLKVIVDNKFFAMVYPEDLERDETLRVGKKFYASIKKIRHDGRVDLAVAEDRRVKPRAASLNPDSPWANAQLSSAPVERKWVGDDELKQKIMDTLEAKGGFLHFNDKTPPAVIMKVFHVSKGKFKAAIGNLYKEKRLLIKYDGIYLPEGGRRD